MGAREESPGSPLAALAVIVLAASLPMAACEDDDSAEAGAPNDVGPGEDATPRYVVVTVLQGLDATTTSVINVVSDLDGGEVDLSAGISVPGFARLWGVPEGGVVYTTDEEALTITKWVLGDGDQLDTVGEVSLAGLGVRTLILAKMAFDGPNRGFFFDPVSGEGAALDLVNMEITEQLDLSPILDEALPTFIGEGSFVRRGDALVGFTYGTDTVNEVVSETSRVFSFQLDSLTFEVSNAPCGGLVNSMLLPDGELVMSTDPWVSALHAIDPERAPAPCLVRLAEGQEPSEATRVDLNELSGGLPTGGIVQGFGTRAFLRVLDPDETPITEDSTASLLAFVVPAWQTWEIDLSTDEPARRLERNGIVGSITVFEVDGAVYENESGANLETSTLVRTDLPSGLEPGLVVPGIPFGLVRIR